MNNETNAGIRFTRNGKDYVLLFEPSYTKAIIEYESSYSKNNNAYWIYKCFGLHTGEPFEIAVMNPHYEADGDESGIWYYLTNNGILWADDLSNVDDDVNDWYSDAINDAVRLDYSEG